MPFSPVRLLALVLAACGALTASAAAAAPSFVPGEVVVRFSPDHSAADRQAALSAIDAADAQTMRLPDTRLVTLDGGVTVNEAVQALNRRDDVLWAEPNYIYETQRTPNDTSFGLQWGQSNTGQLIEGLLGTPGADMSALAAWDQTIGSRGVLVGVADTGVAQHADLDANVRSDLARDFRAASTPSDPAADSSGHGTHVAGTVGAVGDNARGVAGVNWQTGIVPLRVLNGNSGTNADIAAGFAYAGQRGIPVVNASLGGPDASQAIADAIALSPNTLFVLAAGNDANDNDVTPSYPCALPAANIVCVAALTNQDALASFSNWGLTSVDIGAPGQAIYSTYPTWQSEALPISPFATYWDAAGTNNDWGLTGADTALSSNATVALAASTNSTVTFKNALDLSAEKGCRVSATVAFDIGTTAGEPDAYLMWETSTDGLQWNRAGLLGRSHPAYPMEVALPDGASDAQFRIRLYSNDTVQPGHTGAQITNLKMECLTAGETYRYLNGTSMASPQVAGAAALLLSARPDLTVAQVRTALLSSAVPIPALAGKTVTGGRLDLVRGLALIPRAPAPTPTPVPSGGSTPAPTVPEPAPAVPAVPAEPPAVLPAPQAQRVPVVKAAAARPTVSRRGVVMLRLTVSEPVTAQVRGTVSWRGGKITLRPVLVRLTPRRSTVRLQVPAKQLRKLRAARAARRKLTVTTVVAVPNVAGVKPVRTVTRLG